MKTYKSHKEVQAAKIIGFHKSPDGGAVLELEGTGSWSVTGAWLKRHGGQDHDGPDADHDLVGGYLVVYPGVDSTGEYLSWSPPEAFEGGYKEMNGEIAGLPVAGYKPTQPQWAVDLVGTFKVDEERLLRRLDTLRQDPNEPGVDQRWLAIGRTAVEQAFMAINRSIFQPGRVELPEDAGDPATGGIAFGQGRVDLEASADASKFEAPKSGDYSATHGRAI